MIGFILEIYLLLGGSCYLYCNREGIGYLIVLCFWLNISNFEVGGVGIELDFSMKLYNFGEGKNDNFF